MALEAAQVILFVVNLQEGIVPLDVEVARRLRGANKPVLVVESEEDWERFLENDPPVGGVRLQLRKKAARVPGITYAEALDVALQLSERMKALPHAAIWTAMCVSIEQYEFQKAFDGLQRLLAEWEAAP